MPGAEMWVSVQDYCQTTLFLNIKLQSRSLWPGFGSQTHHYAPGRGLEMKSLSRVKALPVWISWLMVRAPALITVANLLLAAIQQI